jgi:hypothetical protein
MPNLDEIGGWITEELPALVAKYKVPGAAIGVYRGGEVFDFAAGVLSRATKVEATADSVSVLLRRALVLGVASARPRTPPN